MMLGGYLSGRLAGRLTPAHTLAWSFAGMLCTSAVNVGYHALHAAALPWTVLPLFVYATGMALALPTLTLIGLDYFPTHRGLASSCQAFLLTAANALTAGVLAPFASATPLRLALTAGTLLLLALACTPFLRRVPALALDAAVG
jgi:DHA1 family bicyclomycin/chloramphenicol resistance-like MFS transporter